MVQKSRTKPSWIRWGLMFVYDTQFTDEKYANYVEACNDAVVTWLEDHLDDSNKWGQLGFRFYDILKIANPELYNHCVLRDGSKTTLEEIRKLYDAEYL